VTDDDAPKSAYELALARLRARDREEGIEEKAVSEEQKAKIAEIRRVYEARLAEREILHQSERQKARDYEELEKLTDDYRRDRERTQAERDRKIDEVRSKG